MKGKRTKKSGRGKTKRMRGGNPLITALPTVLGAVNTVAKTIKPASMILDKYPNANKIPVLGTLLRTAKQFGYGAEHYGAYITPHDNAQALVEKRRRIGLVENGGQRGPVATVYRGTYGSGLRLFNY